MGTFIVRASALVSGGTPNPMVAGVGWIVTPGYTILEVANSIAVGIGAYGGTGTIGIGEFDYPSLTFNDELVFETAGNVCYLDGSSTPININSLPAGFRITSARIQFNSNQFTLNEGTIGYGRYNIRNANGTLGTLNVPWFDYIMPITNLTLFGGFGLSIRAHLEPLVGHFNFGATILNNFRIDGTYDIFNFTYPTIDTPAVNTIGPNNKIRITSTYDINPSTALDLSHIVTNGIDPVTGSYNQLNDTKIAGVGLTWIDLVGVMKYYFIPLRYLGDIEPTLLEFEIPPPLRKLIWQDPTIPGWPDVPITPIVYGDGTQFSGWVSLTPVTITLVDASGIYRLVKDKTNDTLYNNLNPPATNIVKIPNPFIKTGFIGG